MHFYTFRPPAPTVRTGTADAERWSCRPRMVCGKVAEVPLGIGSFSLDGSRRLPG